MRVSIDYVVIKICSSDTFYPDLPYIITDLTVQVAPCGVLDGNKAKWRGPLEEKNNTKSYLEGIYLKWRWW